MKEKKVVLSLGGSLIVPDEGIDVPFLKKFREFIFKKVKKGFQFFIVVGGGRTAREYQEAVRKAAGRLTKVDVDWIGIYSTRLNSHLVRMIFEKVARPQIIDDYRKLKKGIREPVVMAAGGRPGYSTDYDAVLLAKKYEVGRVVNLSNIKTIYDRDPKKFSEARPIEKISWDDYLNLIGGEWTPGLRVPFDPVASKMAKKIGLKVIICHGHDFKNLDKILQGKPFVGTVIE